MFLDTVDALANTAAAKAAFLKRSPGGFFVSSMMAGAFVGLGIILIFSLASDVDPAYRAIVMGATFGVALTLVIFAGSDLFTGHTMFMTHGVLRKKASMSDLAACWTMSWIGNLAGCIVLALVFVWGGGGAMLHSKSQFLMAVATAKENAPILSLVARATLCNWLVCLAIWMSARTTNDAAKCVLIWWCLFAFIGSGYEHSIANMTLLLIALMGDHPATVTWGGLVYNLFWVTIGNIIAGAGIMGIGYWYISRPVGEKLGTAGPVAEAAE
ncbi:MAG TPA: nitrite transporter NirC [Stellaceae bacterium]|jgi:nitrite transporter NirC|nr:nitrite transporter NirC [Stellaceae bacterium]